MSNPTKEAFKKLMGNVDRYAEITHPTPKQPLRDQYLVNRYAFMVGLLEGIMRGLPNTEENREFINDHIRLIEQDISQLTQNLIRKLWADKMEET